VSETQTPRFNLSQWSADSDAAVTRADLDDDNLQVETLATIGSHGLIADRPAPGVRERLYYATDTGQVSWDDGAAWHTINPTITIPIPIAFHAAYQLTVGLKDPCFIAPVDMTLLSAQAKLLTGSAATYRIYIDGAAHTNIPASAAVGTSVVLNDFTDTNIDAGHTVQLYIANAGSSAAGLSVTVRAIAR
jgi:hypothetical protein